MSCSERIQIGIKKLRYEFKSMPALGRWLENLCPSDFKEILIKPHEHPTPEKQVVLEITPDRSGY